jgi:hypothetical protein
VLGDGLLPSVDFNLAPGSGHVALRVSPTARSSHTVAAGLAITGAVSASAAVLLFFLDLASRGTANALGGDAPSTQAQLINQATTYEDIGLGLVGGGVALALSGLVVVLTSKTDLAPATTAAAASRPSLRLSPGGFAF